MNLSPRSKNILMRIAVCALILLVGITGMFALANLKKPPSEVRYEERPIQVEATEAALSDVRVMITGYGEIRALNTVPISSEVSGKVVRIHPRLETGEIIAEGDLLFEIDPINYESALLEAKATVKRLREAIRVLEKKYALDRERLKTLNRNRELAHAEFKRLDKLFEQDRVGTRSNVDAAERAFNLAMDQADQMAQALALYPIQISEAQMSLASAEAGLSMAEANFKRCRVYAPFKGRVKEVSVEQGQYVTPGSPVVTLADDSILEIQVPIDSRDARQWLQFADNGSSENLAWFSKLRQVTCDIKWTEDTGAQAWNGNLHRVVKFDQTSRTIHLAVRIEASEAFSNGGRGLPLVEGMFCSVMIPGRMLNNVFSLPRWAVSYENTVYLSRNNRLQTVPVKVARVQGDSAFVSSGIEPGDLVITTRLVNPLEKSLLSISAIRKVQEAL